MQSPTAPLAASPLVTVASDETCTVVAIHTATEEGRQLYREVMAPFWAESRARREDLVRNHTYLRNLSDPAFLAGEVAGFQAAMAEVR